MDERRKKIIKKSYGTFKKFPLKDKILIIGMMLPLLIFTTYHYFKMKCMYWKFLDKKK